MGKLTFVLDDEREEKFRAEVFKQLGMKKGNISDALAEAIDGWIEQNKKKKKK